MDEPKLETELADSEPQRRGGPWKLIVGVVIATLIGVWLVPADDPEKTRGRDAAAPDAAPSLLGTAAPGGDAAAPGENADAGPSAGTLAPPVAAEPVDDRPGARARALIASMRASGEIRLDDIHAAAVEAQAAGELADAYLLYFFAAREGHAAAALALGSQADPASHDPANSVFASADLTQAHKWYQIAAQNGDSEGRDHLADLRARVEKLAAGGDPQAQRIALLWQ